MSRFIRSIGLTLLCAAFGRAQSASDLAREIVSAGRYQTELPGEPGDDATRGDRSWVREMEINGRRRRELRVPTAAVGLSPVIWAALGVAVVLGVVLLIRGSSAAGEDVTVESVDHDRSSEVAPAAFDPGSAPLDEAERLAAAGRYGEAIRILLYRTFDALRSQRSLRIAPWMTSRGILKRAKLERQSRQRLAALVTAVERSLFAHRESDREDYERCVRAFRELADTADEQVAT